MIHRTNAPGGPFLSRACRGLLVLLVLAGSALAGVPWIVAAQDGEANRAALVIQFEGGQVEKRCVEFQAAEITGADLLAQSGLDTSIDASSGLGITVCQIEGQGCRYPTQACFCQCSGSGPCAYWNYYYRDPGDRSWTYAPLGALLRKVRDGSVDAWLWGNGQVPPADDLSFEAVCPAVAPAAATATGKPTLVASSPVTAASFTPSAGAATIESQGTSVPVPAGQTGGDYVLFGVMALGLLLAGAIVWLKGRRR